MIREVIRGRAAFLCLLALICLHAAEATPPAWRWSNPRPHGNHILEMMVWNGVIWQAADRGQIYTLEDIYGWDAHATTTPNDLRSLTVFRGEVFISGEKGTILRGSSPGNLVAQDLGTQDWLEGIVASPERVVAVGDNGAIYASSDGTNWDRRPGFTTWLRGVAYGLGRFVAVGENGLIISSETGVNWNPVMSSTAQHLNRVACIGDRFWVVGDGGVVLTNNANMGFVPASPGATNDLYAVAGNGSEVVVAGDRAVLRYDLNVKTWSWQSHPTEADFAPAWPYYSALWTGESFLVGGRTGMLAEGMREPGGSGLVWVNRSQATWNWLWAIHRAPGFYVAVGDEGTVVTSDNGGEWDREVVPESVLDKVLLGVGGNTNVLVGVGAMGTIIHSPNVITNIVSTNSLGEVITNEVPLMGVFWYESDSPTTNSLQAVAGNGERVVAAGAGGTILTSVNGSNWVSRASPVESYISGMTSWPGGFVATGDFGTILTSPDGMTWNSRSSGVTNWVYNVRYLNGGLVAVGEAGLVLTSSDGAEWTRRTPGTDLWLNDAAYTTGQYYVAANNGYLFTSPDLNSWRRVTLPTPRSIYGATAGDGQLVVVGLEGVILRRQFTSITTPVNFFDYTRNGGVNQFVFGGAPDQFFALQRSERLDGSWQTIAELEILRANGTLHYEWVEEGRESSFFRTVTLP